MFTVNDLTVIRIGNLPTFLNEILQCANLENFDILKGQYDERVCTNLGYEKGVCPKLRGRAKLV